MKQKAVITVPKSVGAKIHAEKLASALSGKFGVSHGNGFEFSIKEEGDGTKVMASGPWELPANQRPALPTMTTFADGYLACLKDHTSPNDGVVMD